MHCMTLHCIALHYINTQYIHTLHAYIHALHCITLHYIALHCITLHYIALHCITLHYIALHYIHILLWYMQYVTITHIVGCWFYHPSPTYELQKSSQEGMNRLLAARINTGYVKCLNSWGTHGGLTNNIHIDMYIYIYPQNLWDVTGKSLSWLIVYLIHTGVYIYICMWLYIYQWQITYLYIIGVSSSTMTYIVIHYLNNSVIIHICIMFLIILTTIWLYNDNLLM